MGAPLVPPGSALPGPSLPSLIVSLVLTCACGSSTPTEPPGTPAGPLVPSGASPLVTSMFQELPGYVARTLTEQQALLPANQHAAAQINAKIALLQQPTLVTDMVNGRLFVEGGVTSIDGRRIAIAALFPDERMRPEAARAVSQLERAFGPLESFMQTPYPAATLSLWYGFKVGQSGTRGAIYAEDEISYQSRSGPLPYDAGLVHELGHSYFASETLTQFLEVFLFNRLSGTTAAFDTWAYRRGYPGMLDSNQGIAALLDVYVLIGPDSMSNAYRLAFPLGPPNGQPLPPTVQDVFVLQAPPDVRELVAEKMRRILT